MGWLIDKIREWLCDHEWECLLEKSPVYKDYYNLDNNIPSYYQWVYVCKKCGRKRKITSE